MNGKAGHATFVIERALPGRPAHAFRFWSEPALKRLWNSCHPEWETLESRFDFRKAGSEATRWRMPEGGILEVRAHYFEIEPAVRIVYAYEMVRDGRCLSVSLATAEFAPEGAATRMTFTEQAAFLDGSGPDARRAGTDEGFDRLAAVMEQAETAPR
ncbi:SRPBCC family protein [Propylenella binzhouense]|uniref:ATPase n=1 Tax=Propylenella binzhouense TaxID=2555902 RepID=A0A964T613_9HYPH|nr:SRPBCC family protein [Propylenella binzhouense]MYZ49123.1 ATPase [Propylenella binzhouense]